MNNNLTWDEEFKAIMLASNINWGIGECTECGYESMDDWDNCYVSSGHKSDCPRCGAKESIRHTATPKGKT